MFTLVKQEQTKWSMILNYRREFGATTFHMVKSPAPSTPYIEYIRHVRRRPASLRPFDVSVGHFLGFDVGFRLSEFRRRQLGAIDFRSRRFAAAHQSPRPGVRLRSGSLESFSSN